MTGILLISHSKKITDGLKEMIEEMTGTNSQVEILSLGGTDDGRLGTSAIKILEGIEACELSENIFLFCDIGSAILSAEVAMEMASDNLQDKLFLVDAPLIEGAFSAAITASVGASKEQILEEISSI